MGQRGLDGAERLAEEVRFSAARLSNPWSLVRWVERKHAFPRVLVQLSGVESGEAGVTVSFVLKNASRRGIGVYLFEVEKTLAKATLRDAGGKKWELALRGGAPQALLGPFGDGGRAIGLE